MERPDPDDRLDFPFTNRELAIMGAIVAVLFTLVALIVYTLPQAPQ